VPVLAYTVAALVAYLLGSIPTGFLVAKARGIDIRKVGSGNIGATNVLRALGKPAAISVLLADAVKGWLAVVVASSLVCNWLYPAADSVEREWFHLCAGVFAILGHNYTCWLYFKGGKGIATSAGVLTALVPVPLLIIFSVWIIVFALSRYVSLASMSASFTLPFATLVTGGSLRMVLVCAGVALLAIYKHRGNIKRLVEGTEHRFGQRKAQPAEGPGRTQ
jgi:glycerol-3-phosphate acyltransferase PlsY